MQVLDIFRSPRRWDELGAWAKRCGRTRDCVLQGRLAGESIGLDGSVIDVSAISAQRGFAKVARAPATSRAARLRCFRASTVTRGSSAR
jgi:hypothetical protein